MIINIFIEDWLSTNQVGHSRDVSIIQVAWLPPGDDWVKLNTDGSRDGNMDTIAAGGVLRNNRKMWLQGFSLRKGSGSVLEAELWGMYEGLSMAWKSGYRNIVVESDSLSTIQLLAKIPDPLHPLLSIIQSCKHLISAEWNCNVVHAFREGNRLADGLARMGHTLELGLHLFEEPPIGIKDIYEADLKGLACARQCLACPP